MAKRIKPIQVKEQTKFSINSGTKSQKQQNERIEETYDVENYLNPLRHFQLVFIATRHDYRSPRFKRHGFIIQTAFHRQINEFEWPWPLEYFRTTCRLTSLTWNMHTLIIHNVRTFKARIHRDELSFCAHYRAFCRFLSSMSLVKQFRLINDQPFIAKKINRLVT